VVVHVFNNRTEHPYGIAIVKDRNGNKVYRMEVKVTGLAGRNRMKTNSDTPLRTYDIDDKAPWRSSSSSQEVSAFGPNPRLVFEGESGEIKKSGRSLIRIHGGRQNDKSREPKNC
jgi:hypothetical protein